MQYDPKISEQKAHNAEVFSETMQICRNGGYDLPAGRHIELPKIEDVLSASIFYNEVKNVIDIPQALESRVEVVKMDCIDATQELVEQGFNPIMLNMASRRCPGGGVLNGARAQEETLFRRSNLCVSLYQYDEYCASLLSLPLGAGRYPMDYNAPGIYSGRIMFFRKSEQEGYAVMNDPFECAVVSAAAISHPELNQFGRLVERSERATIEKIRNVLRIGLINGHDSIVLGAWGCGAFRNPPEHIAELFKVVIEESEFANKYRIIRFAIIEDHNSRNVNFNSFVKVFEIGNDKKDSSVDIKRNENNEIIDHIEAVRSIIRNKCSRCDPGINGCMGCLYDTIAGEMIPSSLDRVIKLMSLMPNDRSSIVAAAMRRIDRRETL